MRAAWASPPQIRKRGMATFSATEKDGQQAGVVEKEAEVFIAQLLGILVGEFGNLDSR